MPQLRYLLRLSWAGYVMYFGDTDAILSVDGVLVDVHGQLEDIQVKFQIDLFRVAPEDVSANFKLHPSVDVADLVATSANLNDGYGELYYLPAGTWASRQRIVSSRVQKPGYTLNNEIVFLLETIKPEDEGTISPYEITKSRWPHLPSVTSERTTLPYIIGTPGLFKKSDGSNITTHGSPAYYLSTQNEYFSVASDQLWNGVYNESNDNVFINYTFNGSGESYNNLEYPENLPIKPGTFVLTWRAKDGNTYSVSDDSAGGFIDEPHFGSGSTIDYSNGELALNFANGYEPETGSFIKAAYDFGAVPVGIAAGRITKKSGVRLYSKAGDVAVVRNLTVYEIYDETGSGVFAVFVSPPTEGEEESDFRVAWTTSIGIAGNAKELALFIIGHYNETFDINRSREALEYMELVEMSTYIDDNVSPVDYIETVTTIAPVSLTSGPQGIYFHVIPHEIVETLRPELRLYDGENAFMIDEEMFESELSKKDIKVNWAYVRDEDSYTESTVLDESSQATDYDDVDSESIVSYSQAKKATYYREFLRRPALESEWEVFTVIEKGTVVAVSHEGFGLEEHMAVVTVVDISEAIIKIRVRLLGRGGWKKKVSRGILWGEPEGERWGDDDGIWGEE